ncbi:MAG: 1-(5-phosphoribosyl)-5-[(5-phosphoribosylamino)methylideneamino]imidazole-4-carboxamide isomerase [Cyclobacteriaceae bacterium]|nr:1-(5-phosphoribosyl)-5-[(5-phosphoribosylamino)methylideneamino]imidazole-4-carboxamide isomerase [Cyclobacteriaceae bacterium SS2]
MQIIPAIDLIDGKCVRLTKGDYNAVKEYNSDPLEVARQFEGAGIKRLHLVDLDGAKASHVVNIDVLRNICQNTGLQVDFGGGVKSEEDLQKVFDAGAQQVTAGSIAAKDPDKVKQWIADHGSDRIILGADVLGGKVMVSGWQKSSGLSLFEFLADYHDAGARWVICTDISKDGVMEGPSFELYREIVAQFPDINLIASGGVTTMADLESLREDNLYGAIIGKAYYEGKLSLQQLSSF